MPWVAKAVVRRIGDRATVDVFSRMNVASLIFFTRVDAMRRRGRSATVHGFQPYDVTQKFVDAGHGQI